MRDLMRLYFIPTGLQVSVVGLERALYNYSADPTPAQPFDMKTVPIDTQPMTAERAAPGSIGITSDRSEKKVRYLLVTQLYLVFSADQKLIFIVICQYKYRDCRSKLIRSFELFLMINNQ